MNWFVVIIFCCILAPLVIPEGTKIDKVEKEKVEGTSEDSVDHNPNYILYGKNNQEERLDEASDETLCFVSSCVIDFLHKRITVLYNTISTEESKELLKAFILTLDDIKSIDEITDLESKFAATYLNYMNKLYTMSEYFKYCYREEDAKEQYSMLQTLNSLNIELHESLNSYRNSLLDEFT